MQFISLIQEKMIALEYEVLQASHTRRLQRRHDRIVANFERAQSAARGAHNKQLLVDELVRPGDLIESFGDRARIAPSTYRRGATSYFTIRSRMSYI